MNNIPSIHFLFRWYIFIYILLWLAAAPTPQSNQIQQTMGREEARGRTREHFNGLCIGGDNFLSSLAVEIVCLALWQALSPTHFGEEGGETGWGTSHVGDITWLHTGAPWWGVIFCDIVDLVSQRPPATPNVTILFSWKLYAESHLTMSAKACSKDQDWDLSLTTRATHHLFLMDPTYAVITMPTSCQLWCRQAFVPQRDSTISGWSPSSTRQPPQRSHQNKCFSFSLRSYDLKRRETPSDTLL